MKYIPGLITTVLFLSIMVMPVRAEEVFASHGMVTSAHPLATRAGIEVLRRGGNAVDAAVAVASALNVVEFNASGIGGGGFMTLYLADKKRVTCIDYRETAPASARADMFACEKAKKSGASEIGGTSVAVPGWLKGMDYALSHYGTMSFGQVTAPAVALAEKGFVLKNSQSGYIMDSLAPLFDYNSDYSNFPFFGGDGMPLSGGDVLKQPQLAATFRLIAEKGSDLFYRGEIGKAICNTVNRSGGNMTMEDLASYKVIERTPVSGTYRGYRIYSVPPASSGGTHVIEMLNILENFDLSAEGTSSPENIRLFAEACKHVFADRKAFMADTDFTEVPLKGLTSKEYAAGIASQIRRGIAGKVAPGDPWSFQKGRGEPCGAEIAPEHFSTTSFSVTDDRGNIVTCTNTINHFMGSCVCVPPYGFLLNDEMDDFSPDPESVNAPAPGKRPLSSMSPTIVLDSEKRPFMSIGTPGATRIITAVTQCIINVIDHGMSMDAAIEAPRFHIEKGRTIKTENDRYDEKLLATLRDLGYRIELKSPNFTGGAQGILFHQKKSGTAGYLDGGADSRRLGTAEGY